MNTTSFASLRKSSLALAVVAAICSTGAITIASAAPSDGSMATVAHTTLLRKGDAVTGALSMAQPIHIEVALKMRDRDGLNTFIATNAKNALGAVQKPMSREQFMANHAPTQVQAQTVANYLTNMGYKNVAIAPNRLLVSADGTAATARAAFLTSFAQVKTREGRTAFANTDDARIPTALKDMVLSVVGLQTVHQAHTFAKQLPKGSAHTNAIVGHNPNEFSSIYGGTGVATAAGVAVGIITQGKLDQTITDLNTFTANSSLPTVTTQTVNTNGTSNDTAGVGEWDLDSQDIVGAGGGQVGKIIFYNIPTLTNSDLTADINTAVAANAAKVINVSLGECETSAQGDGSAAAQDQSFATAVAQGQTFSISTGDSGADECGDGGTKASWPAASQFVIAAAGTTLDASTTTFGSETVWAGSGGSASSFEPKPSWQNALVPGTKRGVADIAFDADPNSGSTIIFNGASAQFGGTSLSAPIFAGLWARVIAVRGVNVGFAGPLLYNLPASDFHDVTVGNNGGSTAGVGYDFASGRGSLILSSAITHIPVGNNPPVANFGYSANGLTVNFTDSSSDSDGTVVSHAWAFGDGATSTATNPSHTYAAAGPYSVSETVTDNGGASNTKTSLLTLLNGGAQLLGNPGFETGTAAPWTISPGVLNNSTAQPAHAGLWDALLDGRGIAHTDVVSQQVAIPAGKTSALLSFYLHIDSKEITKTRAFDTLKVQVTTPGGTLLGTLATYSNLNSNTGYQVRNLVMTPYIGQTVVLKFVGKEDGSLQTSFVVDDVTLNVLP